MAVFIMVSRNSCATTVADNLLRIQQKKVISQETWDLVDKLLLEKIPIAGISKVTGISEPWLQRYLNDKYENIDQQINVVKKGLLTIQCDEMWSFVKMKSNKKWIWLAIDVDSKQIVGVYVGSRDCIGATKDFGIHCRRFIDSVLFVIQIFGQPTKKFFQPKGTKPWGKRVEKQTTLKDLILQCGKESHGL